MSEAKPHPALKLEIVRPGSDLDRLAAGFDRRGRVDRNGHRQHDAVALERIGPLTERYSASAQSSPSKKCGRNTMWR